MMGKIFDVPGYGPCEIIGYEPEDEDMPYQYQLVGSEETVWVPLDCFDPSDPEGLS